MEGWVGRELLKITTCNGTLSRVFDHQLGSKVMKLGCSMSELLMGKNWARDGNFGHLKVYKTCFQNGTVVV